MIGPRFVDKNYELRKGESPYQELKELFGRRNAIMHHKPYHEVNGKVVHRGKFPKVESNEHRMVEAICDLPMKMLHHIIDNDKVSETFGFYWVRKIWSRSDRTRKIPRKIKERIMSTLSLRLPNSLHSRIKELAKAEGISINQFISTAAAEKISAMLTEDYLRNEAALGRRDDFEAVLRKVPDVPPEPYDRKEYDAEPGSPHNAG